MQTLALVLLNYLFILAAITLFVCPFYIVYAFRNAKCSRGKGTRLPLGFPSSRLPPLQGMVFREINSRKTRAKCEMRVFKRHRQKPARPRSANQELEDFFQSKQANWLVFFWAFGEALVWFVIPEFLLLLVIFMRINRKRELLLFDIYGTTAGAIVAYSLNLPVNLIYKLPYIQPKMVEQTQLWYEQHGILGLIYQPFSGVPYKVFTFLAPHYHFFILAFVIVAVVVRIARYYIFFAMFSLIYPVLHKYVHRNYLRLVLVAIFIFSILLLRVYESYANYNVSARNPALTIQMKAK